MINTDNYLNSYEVILDRDTGNTVRVYTTDLTKNDKVFHAPNGINIKKIKSKEAQIKRAQQENSIARENLKQGESLSAFEVEKEDNYIHDGAASLSYLVPEQEPYVQNDENYKRTQEILKKAPGTDMFGYKMPERKSEYQSPIFDTTKLTAISSVKIRMDELTKLKKTNTNEYKVLSAAYEALDEKEKVVDLKEREIVVLNKQQEELLKQVKEKEQDIRVIRDDINLTGKEYLKAADKAATLDKFIEANEQNKRKKEEEEKRRIAAERAQEAEVNSKMNQMFSEISSFMKEPEPAKTPVNVNDEAISKHSIFNGFYEEKGLKR